MKLRYQVPLYRLLALFAWLVQHYDMSKIMWIYAIAHRACIYVVGIMYQV